MKQPELGKKILELRKSKGLTQEELVEKCNINVRTIQRIEAGEVTPRSYTVKTILEALEVDSNFIFQSDSQKNEIQFTKQEKNQLNISWITGIFFLVLSVVGIILEFYEWNDSTSNIQLIYRIPFNILYLITLIFFIRGYHILGKHFQKMSLVNSVYAYFVIEVVVSILTTMAVFFDLDTYSEVAIGIPVVILYGAAELIMGLGITRLKKDLGSFANFLGILKIINGGMLVSVILSPIALFMAVPILILEVVFMYNMATNSKFHHS